MDHPDSARAWLDIVLDEGYELLFEDIVGGDPLSFPGYAAQLEAARARTRCTESALIASGTIEGARVVAMSFEFAFLGGSMGVASGERICRAFELAARERLPVVALTASGGARMQEGMLALAQMPATLIARKKFAAAHKPFIAYLRNPTTGGVYASFASSADVIWAEPGATIGFAGPRVAETFTGRPLPEGSHTAEWAHGHGLVHEIVEPAALRARLRATVELPRFRSPNGKPDEPGTDATPAIDIVRGARDAARLTADDFTVWTTAGGAAIKTGIGYVGSRPAIVIAQTRRPIDARAYRAARDAISTAQNLQLPIVTFVDTPGADPSTESEANGIAREISRTFDALLAATVPTVACVIGEGGSGGALALAACDRVLIQEKAFFSVIAPEGAAAILRREDIDQVGEDLRLTARDLRVFGLADLIVPESSPGPVTKAMLEKDAHAKAFLTTAMSQAIEWALDDAEREGAPTAQRADRWRVWKP